MTDSPAEAKFEVVRFSVASISCFAYTPVFKKGLERVEGIRQVRQPPMLNNVVVEYAPRRRTKLKSKRKNSRSQKGLVSRER